MHRPGDQTRTVSGATITGYPGEGHFIALTRRRDVLESLA